MIPMNITKNDFVRIVRDGPGGSEELYWYVRYRRGEIDVPPDWRLAVLPLRAAIQMVKLTTRILNWLIRHYAARERGQNR